MVADQIAARGVRDESVLKAMLEVPRHLFVPDHAQSSAYADYPLPIGHDQTISQPYIVAFMTEALKIKPGSRVLEIGTGSGYQAAILAAMGCRVFSIEIIGELCDLARENLKKAGVANVTVIQGDGWFGLPAKAPFDGILVTAAPDHIPPKLVEQLRTGARMIVPVGPEGGTQSLTVITKLPEGKTDIQRILPVRFVPLTGGHETRRGDNDE